MCACQEVGTIKHELNSYKSEKEVLYQNLPSCMCVWFVLCPMSNVKEKDSLIQYS